MQQYRINLSKISSPGQLFEELKMSGLVHPACGNNMDALYDALTSTGGQSELVLCGLEDIEDGMREYLDVLRQVCEDAETDNPDFSFSYE
jgi:RNAse (barnase) inhibitor barstar